MAISFGQLTQGYDGTGVQAPDPNVTPEQQQSYAAGWLQHLMSPEVRAGLAQFGANLSQPQLREQTDVGAFTAAAAGGAQAYDRNVIQQQQEEADRIAEAQKQQALATQSRAVGATETGNQLDYAAKLAAIKSRAETQSLTNANRLDIARITQERNLSKDQRDNLTKAAIAFNNNEMVVHADNPEQFNPDKFLESITPSTSPSNTGEAPPPAVAPITAPGAGKPPVPPNLLGKSGVHYNSVMKLFRDNTGQLYNENGEPVK
jgi:hypothetical protein